jgi:adenosine kinase
MFNNSPDFGCIMIGCVGKDKYGEQIIDGLKKVNVDPILEISETELSSRCACGIIDNVRCLLPQIRASSKLSLSFVQNNLKKFLEADILFIEGYFVIDCWDIVKYLLSSFKLQGKKICFTLSAVFMVNVFFDRIKEVSNAADFIFANEEEGEAFAIKLGAKAGLSNKENAELIHHSLDKDEGRVLVLSHGPNPTVVSTWNYDKKSFKEYFEEPVYPIDKSKIEDTNGCGDALVGGFLCEYIKGSDLKKCIKAGQYASYEVIQQIGCQFPEKPSFNLK